MNRQILFKAKRKDNGEWVEGYYVYCRKRRYILPILNKEIGFDERENEWIEIDPGTICQYTGLTDKNGNKMSKRLNNAVDPFTTIEKYGSDPLRWYMITNSSPWDNLKFDVEGIEEVRRKFFGTLYNTYSFFALYANVDGFEYKDCLLYTSDAADEL